jgi:hypothetical protein
MTEEYKKIQKFLNLNIMKFNAFLESKEGFYLLQETLVKKGFLLGLEYADGSFLLEILHRYLSIREFSVTIQDKGMTKLLIKGVNLIPDDILFRDWNTSKELNPSI